MLDNFLFMLYTIIVALTSTKRIVVDCRKRDKTRHTTQSKGDNMGTRNLSLCKLNGEYRIANYGQWDGHPSGQGATILAFCTKPQNLKRLKQILNIGVVRFMSSDDVETFSRELDCKNKAYINHYSLFNSRDVGGNIFRNIIERSNEYAEVLLVNSIDFLQNKLSCEWAYCINYDTNKLEVYSSGDLIKAYDLDNLPSEETFINELEGGL